MRYRAPTLLAALALATLSFGQTTQINEADAWSFSAADDTFAADAAINLRTLNEETAGKTGFVRRSADGKSFVRGDGTPIRFWGVVSDGYNLTNAEMERHAQWLAKRGVNMVRVHTNVSGDTDGSQVTAVDTFEIEKIHRWVAVCKKYGIYLTISPYWAHAEAPASWGIEGYAKAAPWGVLFFNPRMQEGYKAWVRALYTTPNPYLGNVALKDEPAVAIAQVKNEDSLLFWTFQDIKAPQKRILGEQFGNWAKERYGSIAAALTAWGNTSGDGDDTAAGVLGFRHMWELTADAPRSTYGTGHLKRLADQMEFLTETQRKFYASMETFYKTEIGIKQLTNAMNWRSADQVTMDDAERYSYTVMDVTAVNFYTGGAHTSTTGEQGWKINPADKFISTSVLNGTAALPANLKQSLNHPIAITETAWVHPNLYQAEGPFLMSAYSAMSGVDITYWFAYGGVPEWQKDPRMSWAPSSLQKWYGAFPMQGGQFPAYAIAFRNGYITEATQNAVYEERSLQDMWEGRIPIISEAGRFDSNRDSGVFAPESPVRQEVDRRAFFVGPVVVKAGGSAINNRVIDLTQYINDTTGEVRSITGELMINAKKGYSAINADKVQGVCGFLRTAGGAFALGSTTWQSTNDYVSLVAVSLDGASLKSARSILVQAGTVSRLKGATTKPTTITADGKTEAAEEIVSNGVTPWMIANTHATLTLDNLKIRKATALNQNLYRAGDVPVRREGGKVVIDLPTDAMYVLLEADAAPTGAPTLLQEPASQLVAPGGSAKLVADVSGAEPLTFQWSRNGTAIAGATDSTYTVANVSVANEGDYSVTITNASGSVSSMPARVALTTSSVAWISNLSVRANMAAGQTLMVGFTTTGGSKDVLVRAAGPGLVKQYPQWFSDASVMSNPRLSYYAPNTSTATASNEDWSGLAGAFDSVGAFGFNEGSKDAALVQPVDGPNHTFWAQGAGSGTVLVEAYAVAPTASPRLTNVSARNQVGKGNDVLIAGFVLQGTGNKKLLIRGIGPRMTEIWGVPGTVANPKLEIYNSAGVKLAENDNWDAADQALLNAFRDTGAYGFSVGGRDSAMIVTLPASPSGAAYTAQVKGVNEGTGEGVVEVYEVP